MYSKVLVPLDGSELAECVLDHLKAIAVGCQVPNIVLLNVIEPVNLPGHVPHEVARDIYFGAKQAAEVHAKKYLSDIAGRISKEGLPVTTDIIEGPAADEILKYSESNQIDLIIMSSHGNSGVSRWYSGSVAEKVLRHSFVPVLVVIPLSCRIKNK